jgi:hypothetical protein
MHRSRFRSATAWSPRLVSPLVLALLLGGCAGGDTEDNPVEGQEPRDCTDGADNDLDGAFDCDDDGCAGAPACAGDTDADPTNEAPGSATIAITPAIPTDADTLACEVRTQATDPDGDAVSYRYAWAVDGVDSGLSGAEVAASFTSVGQMWTCTVTPTDGALDGASESASATVVSDNRAPSAPTVAITPAEPGDDDDLLCSVTTDGIDPDGDPVSYTYAWTLDGEDAGLSSASVAAGLTSPTQEWTCTVTPTDGSLAGGAASASVTIVSDTCAAWDTSGTGSYVWTADAAMPATWLKGTWEGWFRLDGSGSVPCASGGTAIGVWLDARLNTGDYGGSGSANGVIVTSSSSGLYTTISTGGASGISLSTALPTEASWHHVAVTYDGDTEEAVLYVDGDEEDRGDVGMDFLVTNDRFGVAGSLPCEGCGGCQSDPAYLNGAVDWARVSDSVRYTEPFRPPRTVRADADTVLLWDFDLDDTDVVLDLSGEGRDGEIHGGAVAEECNE